MKHFRSILSILLFVFLFGINSQTAQADSFNAGKIIDDAIFTNSSSMSVSQIQDFLNSKVPTCDTNGTMPASDFGRPDLTHAQYAASRGWSAPPYTCLKNYTENGVSSSQLIYNLSKQYQINPQALIVTLQKESSLVTDYWPLSSQYRTATGYGCPDSGPNNSANCSSNYYGFTNQITWTAKMYRAVLNQSPTWYSPYVVGTNYVQWNPNANCGGSNVNIQNWATAALYDYTPYQPNAAALNAGYGMGDGCSAYGNRNFFLFFTDWFGSTSAPGYQASYYSQSQYPNLVAGETSTGWIMYKNSGTQTWQDSIATQGAPGMVNLSTTNPNNRSSVFGSTWGSDRNRPAASFAAVYEADGTTLATDQHRAKPGQIVKFSIPFTTSETTKPDTYREWFFPVREGVSDWYMGGYAYLDVNVQPAVRKMTFYSQSAYPSGKQGETVQGWIMYKNSGNQILADGTLTVNSLNLATANANNRSSIFGATWGADRNRPAGSFSTVYEADGITLSSDQHRVRPGQIVKYNITFTIPSNAQPGDYTEWFEPIVEGSPNWYVSGEAWLRVTIQPTVRKMSFYNQSAYPSGKPGETVQGWIMYKNAGNQLLADGTVSANGLNLATANANNRSSIFGATWGSDKNRPAVSFAAVYEADGTTLAADQHRVQPGQIVKYNITFTITANTQPGDYTEWFEPIVEGSPNWYVMGEAWLRVTVHL